MIPVRQLVACGLLAGGLIAVGCGKKSDPTPKAEIKPGSGATPQPQPQLTGEALEAAKAEAVNRLKQVGLAMLSYAAANGQFPANIVGTDNQLGLSWRVQLLPYFGDEEAKLFREFKLNEPWNSPHNKPLLAKMPKVYESTGRPNDPGTTFLQSFFGPKAFLRPLVETRGGKPTESPKFEPGAVVRGRKITDITDGTINSLMVVEGHEPVEWTKPDDIGFMPFGGKSPPTPPLAGVFKGGLHGLMCDGSVCWIPLTISEKDLSTLITINGGEVVSAELQKLIHPGQPMKDQPKDEVPKAPPPKKK